MFLKFLQDESRSEQQPGERWKEKNRWRKQRGLQTSKLVQAHFSELVGIANNNSPPVEQHIYSIK